MKDAKELLIYSLDNAMTAEERKKLDAALEASAELRAERDQYLKMRKLICETPFTHSPDFTDNIMQKWALQKNKNNFGASVVQLFPRVAAAAVMILFVAWSAIYFSGENMTASSLIGIEEISPDEADILLEF